MSTPNIIDGDSNANTLNGTADADVISGFGGNDTLSGFEGDDVLDGGAGADRMAGGLGDDLYIVDNSADIVTEAADEGTDTIHASVSWALGANVENLMLTGTAVINGIGNGLDNVLDGNSAANFLNGAAGNDTLDGHGGGDTLIGGQGSDTYIVHQGDTIVEAFGEGTDTVYADFTYALGPNVENLVLTGSANIDGFGNALDNVLTGNDGDNILSSDSGTDTLDGGAGADTLIGGTGSDTYVVDNVGDQIIEQASGGTDTVHASISYVLAPALENLVLTGSDALTGTGNATDNLITGNDGDNLLTGLDGNDTIDGGAGADTMVGGAGDDVYGVDNAGDIVTEAAGEGTDTVQATISYTLGDNVENLTLAGPDAIDGTGNAGANVLTGNGAANTLTGLDGNDTLDGGAGADTLIGGLGNDVYYVDDAGDTVQEAAGEGTDTVRASITTTLWANVEALELTGTAAIDATGNAADNTLTGNRGANVLDGGAGADRMVGSAGDDTYLVDNVGDTVIELALEGKDTVRASVSFILSDNVEDLVLTGAAAIDGTGNAAMNTITGTAARNVIDGKGGSDKLDGRDGGDLYLVTDTHDHLRGEIADTGTSGIDELRIAATAAGTTTVFAADTGIERVVIGTGTGLVADTSGTVTINVSATRAANALEIIGNAGANKITGTAFADTIDGGAGIDAMAGGLGDDTFTVDNTADKVIEGRNAGTDHVLASANFTLGANIETLTLIGHAALNGTGNVTANTIEGNDAANVLDGNKGDDTLLGGGGADTLIGGMGADTLTGGDGADHFRFNAPLKLGAPVDTITDFSAAQGDLFEFSKAVFRGLGSVVGGLSADQFWTTAGIPAAHDATDRILYDTTSGTIWYDADGTGKAVAMPIAVVQGHPVLDASDFLIVA